MARCKLCEQPCFLSEEEFCCLGCQTVYQMLKKKGVNNLKEDPLFLHARHMGWLKLDKNSVSSETFKGERFIREVRGMWCSSCSLAIEWLLQEIPGVLFASVDYSSDLLVIRLDPLKTSLLKVEKSLAYWGYELRDPLRKEKQKVSDFFTWKIAAMAFFGMNTMMLSYPAYMSYLGIETQGYEWICGLLSALLSAPLIPLALWPLSRSAFLSFRAGLVGFEFLIVLASSSSLLLSFWRLFQGSPHVYFDTAWVLLGLQFLGKGLEKTFKLRAQEVVLGTLDLAKSKVRIPSSEGWSFIAAKDLKEGDLIGLIPSDIARVDAVIECGTIWVDLSWERGEAHAVELKKGDLVRSGMMVVSGSASAKVQTLAIQSQLQTWIGQLATALEKRKQKAPDSKVERLIAPFTVLILLTALFSALWALAHQEGYQESFERAMSVLVISCPCSLGIAVPLAKTRLFARLTELGFWIRRADSLEVAGQIESWALDKTGTLTEGKMRLVSPLMSDPFYLKCLKAISLHSNHPICLSIQESLKAVLCQDIQLENVHETYGVGLKGYVEGKEVYLGKPSAYLNLDVSCEFKIASQSIALLRFEDPLKEGAKAFVSALQDPILLSGDHQKRCEWVSQQVDITKCYSGKTSLEKASWIKEWKSRHPHQKIAMVGDGLNDALAMQECDFSIAIASDRSDPTSALHWADVALVKNELNPIIQLISFCKRTKLVCSQNLFLGFFYNLIFIPMAFTGMLSPIHAAIAMLLNSISILVNSYRI